MKTTIIITTYNRHSFLYYCLSSIARQDLSGLDYEILVVNDGMHDETEKVALESDAAKLLNIRYIHTGVRHNLYWRCMGFAANIGIRQAKGDIIVLSNSDIYHIGDTIRSVIEGCEKDSTAMSTLNQVYDDDGTLIDYLKNPAGDAKDDEYATEFILNRLRNSPRPAGFYPCNPDVPFCLAVRKEHLMKIGGYDEDFIGCASEDCDLLDRLKAVGCHYVYAKPGTDAVHMYHGRRSIAQLKSDPGFQHNIRLREERKKVIVRNEGREWGKLVDTSKSQQSSPMSMVLWVTSKCNLNCPLCSQRPVRDRYHDYEMSSTELDHFIRSCQERNIRFTSIELTGGEPTLWPLFPTALEKLVSSKITEQVTFITNGNNPSATAKLANRFNLRYVISATQATAEQQAVHAKEGVGIQWNSEPHRHCPSKMIPDTLPAQCSQRQLRDGQVSRELLYLAGRVWYCCTAAANAMRLRQEEPSLSCSFEEDFDSYFSDRRFDRRICSVCLSNKKVWDVI